MNSSFNALSIFIFVIHRSRLARTCKSTNGLQGKKDLSGSDLDLYKNPVYSSNSVSPSPDILAGINPSTRKPQDKKGIATKTAGVGNGDNSLLNRTTNVSDHGDYHIYNKPESPPSQSDSTNIHTYYYTLEKPSKEQRDNTPGNEIAHYYQEADIAMDKIKMNDENTPASEHVYQELQPGIPASIPHNVGCDLDNPSKYLSLDPKIPTDNENQNPYQGLQTEVGAESKEECIRQNGEAALYDESEYNSLTFRQPSLINRSPGSPKQTSEINTNTVTFRLNENIENDDYAVLNFSRDSDKETGIVDNEYEYHCLNDLETHDRHDHGVCGESDKTEKHPSMSDAYQSLAPTSMSKDGRIGVKTDHHNYQDLNKFTEHMIERNNVHATGYQSLKTREATTPTSKSADSPGGKDRESAYHDYQDPDGMSVISQNMVPLHPEAFDTDQYNLLHSGKELGDYHPYQNTGDMVTESQMQDCEGTEYGDYSEI